MWVLLRLRQWACPSSGFSREGNESQPERAVKAYFVTLYVANLANARLSDSSIKGELLCSTATSCCAHSDRTLRCEEVVHNLSLDEQSVLAGNECLLRKIRLSLMASRKQNAKKM
jgi:hypothetical protein